MLKENIGCPFNEYFSSFYGVCIYYSSNQNAEKKNLCIVCIVHGSETETRYHGFGNWGIKLKEVHILLKDLEHSENSNYRLIDLHKLFG